MAFTSFRFIVFLVLAAAAYFLTPKRCRWVTLFVANYVFYFISGGRIFIYLLATTVTTYLATVKIGDMAAKNKIAFNEAKRHGKPPLQRKRNGFSSRPCCSTSGFWQC